MSFRKAKDKRWIAYTVSKFLRLPSSWGIVPFKRFERSTLERKKQNKETKEQRNKETKKQRNKETKKQRNKETKKQRERVRERVRERERETERERERFSNRPRRGKGRKKKMSRQSFQIFKFSENRGNGSIQGCGWEISIS